MVFMYVADPIGAKLVERIRHPGGNATGLTNFGLELVGKRLEHLKEITPQLARVAMIVNPTNPISNFYVEQSNAAGPKLRLTCKPYNVGTLDGLEPAFDAMMGDGMEAVIFNAESLFYVGKKWIAELALARKLPCCGYVKEVLDAGMLISYGTDQRLIARRTAYYVDRILKGERPADMPVADPFPAPHQSHHRKGARSYHSPHAARTRRRSDRVGLPAQPCDPNRHGFLWPSAQT